MVPFSIFKYGGCLSRGRLFPPPYYFCYLEGTDRHIASEGTLLAHTKALQGSNAGGCFKNPELAFSTTLGEMSVSNKV